MQGAMVIRHLDNIMENVMKLSSKKIKEFEATINAKVWKEPKYRRKLLDDPKGTLKEMGSVPDKFLTEFSNMLTYNHL
jgi:hypothetical protein